MEQSLKGNFAMFLFIILVSYVGGHKGCFEEERKGLLELKEVMGFMNHSSLINNKLEFLLSDWVDDEGKNECCEWSQVTCNRTTGHVINISLGHMYRFYYESDYSWSLNLSLFRPFKELRSLNLSYSNVDGWTKSKGLTYFSHLEILDLSGNYHIGGSIPSFIWELSALKALYLSKMGVINGSLHNIQGMKYFSHLEILDLSGNFISGSIPSFIWELSTLKALYLAENELNGSLHNIQGFTYISHLEILDLSWNDFVGSIPSFIWELSTLKALYLARNGLNGSLHIQDFTSLHHLEILDLSLNDFGGSIPSFIWELSTLKALYLAGNRLNGSLHIQGFTSLHHLEILDLRENNIGGSIPTFIWESSSLKVLSLAWNFEINGSLPMQGFCELKKFEELDLSYNNLEGNLPPCLNNLTSLRVLDLRHNRFTGNISSSLIASLTSLEYIDLSHNHFEGLFSFSSFANHSKLQVVEIINNTKFEVETESIDWIPMFQLKSLVLLNCNLNNLSGEVPKFLFHQQRLRILDLSGNQLDGKFPSWLLENNTEIEFLSLRNNSFSGPFHLPTVGSLSVKWMDISNNHFNGGIQANIGQMLPYVYYLNLSRNDFYGGIPSSIGDMSELMHLDLSINYFSGEFPNQVATGCTSLSQLVLSHNLFHGEFPLTQFNSTSMLWLLKLDNNHFTGKLSNDFTGFNNLQMLDISDNFLSGPIPNWISNVTDILVLRNNFFEGQIFHLPFTEYTNFIDFSYNSLTGSLPPFTKSRYLAHINLQGNKFTGSIPESYANLSSLLLLGLNDNNLSGNIPKFIGALSSLRILLLKNNCFSGLIPNQLCHLRNTSLMDLSYNSLTGSIPKCLPNIFGSNHLAFDIREKIYPFGYVPQTFYRYERILRKPFSDFFNIEPLVVEVDFVTKGRLLPYKAGSILDLMSGLDLSCNNMTSEIPIEMGMMVQIHALNLSHNQLTGPIPKHFSQLTQIESLDLSFNSLSGEIPLELVDLTFLAVFIVAHNNLSGRLPERKAQFGTFSKESYEGNPFLCGPQIEKKCTTVASSSPTASSDEDEEKWFEIDLVFFRASFVAMYLVFLLGAATLLYINPYWRRRWFTLVEEYMYSCYDFLCDFMRK